MVTDAIRVHRFARNAAGDLVEGEPVVVVVTKRARRQRRFDFERRKPVDRRVRAADALARIARQGEEGIRPISRDGLIGIARDALDRAHVPWRTSSPVGPEPPPGNRTIGRVTGVADVDLGARVMESTFD